MTSLMALRSSSSRSTSLDVQFSSKREACLVPGMGIAPCAATQAILSWPTEHPFRLAIFSSSSTNLKFAGRFSALYFGMEPRLSLGPWNKAASRNLPVKTPRPKGEYAMMVMPNSRAVSKTPFRSWSVHQGEYSICKASIWATAEGSQRCPNAKMRNRALTSIRFPQSLRADFGQTDVLAFPILPQARQRGDALLERSLQIQPMQIVQIRRAAESLNGTLDGLENVLRVLMTPPVGTRFSKSIWGAA